jgi:arsenical pump membrane protein
MPMPTFAGWVSIAIVVGTVALILIRPRGLNEAWAAAFGAVLMLLTGGLPLENVPGLLRETADVLVFLAAMMILTVIAEHAGVFDVAAEWCARIARGSGVGLFVIVFLLGGLVTAFLSLDVTVIVLTPIVYAITIRRRLDPLPFMFGCTFVANTASLVFPMSNLTNLLVYSQLDLTFQGFVRAMWLPNLVALVTNLAVFLWMFGERIPRRFRTDASADLPQADWWLKTAAIVLAGTLLGLVLFGLGQLPLAVPAAVGALALITVGSVSGRHRALEVAGHVSWPVLAFVVGMLIIVRGLEAQWLGGLDLRLGSSPAGALTSAVVTTAIGSNVVNNVPMALLSIPVVDRAPAGVRELTAYATLLGCNIGPTMTTYGSLATMLWLTSVRKRGIHISTRRYLRVGLVTAPLVLLTSTLALWWTTAR